jgi:hypothetical protein
MSSRQQRQTNENGNDQPQTTQPTASPPMSKHTYLNAAQNLTNVISGWGSVPSSGIRRICWGSSREGGWRDSRVRSGEPWRDARRHKSEYRNNQTEVFANLRRSSGILGKVLWLLYVILTRLKDEKRRDALQKHCASNIPTAYKVIVKLLVGRLSMTCAPRQYMYHSVMSTVVRSKSNITSSVIYLELEPHKIKLSSCPSDLAQLIR